MALKHKETITANGSVTLRLKNIRSNRNIYSVFVGGTFGGGTITALLSGDDTNYVAIKDASGDDVSFTEGGIFNFEVLSDSLQQVMKLRITLAAATSPDINLRVYDSA